MGPDTHHEPEDFQKLFERKICEAEVPRYALELVVSTIKPKRAFPDQHLPTLPPKVILLFQQFMLRSFDFTRYGSSEIPLALA